jgi:alkanesulfonate monooxygenase SsuD/methylene tetrahydromethanopterin reductase-like flavin-dependent oxidoreductase (luciferase family)
VPREFEAFNGDIRQRFEALEDRAREVRRLWNDGDVTPPPVQERPPIWIGTQGPRGARIAGRLGEGLLWLGSELFSAYRAALEESGHDPARARVAGLANLVIADDPEQAWARIAPHLGYQWSSYSKNSLRTGRRQRTSTRSLKRDLDDVMLAGDVDPATLRSAGPDMNPPSFDVVAPTEAVERLRQWLAPLPVDHVYFWASVAGMPEDLVQRHVALLSSHVSPALRDLGVPVAAS